MNIDAQPDLSALTRFLDAAWLQRGLADNTRMAYRSDLEQFAQWLLLRGQTLEQVRRDTLLEYLSWRLESGYKAALIQIMRLAPVWHPDRKSVV